MIYAPDIVKHIVININDFSIKYEWTFIILI